MGERAIWWILHCLFIITTAAIYFISVELSESSFAYSTYILNTQGAFFLIRSYIILGSFLLFNRIVKNRFIDSTNRAQDMLSSIASGLIIGGSLSNITSILDFGGIVDYWQFMDIVWFNLADVGIVVGVLMYLGLIIFSLL